MHTPQSLFDAVARHLLTQREPSIFYSSDAPDFGVTCGNNGCAYRGPRGLKCAIGALIPDDLYDPKFESASVGGREDISRAIRAAAGIPDSAGMRALASQLQALHDRQHPATWRDCLRTVAADRGLSAAVLEEVPA